MQGFSYGQVVSLVVGYLEQYPHVTVALECVREDVEGDGKVAGQVIDAIERLNEGQSDVHVLRTWGEEVGSRDLMQLATRIEEAYEKQQDIGFYVKKHSLGAAAPKREVVTQQNKRKNNRNSNYKGKGRKPFKPNANK